MSGAPDFASLGITDRCSRCGRPYSEHPHAYGEECVIGNPHAFRFQPMPGRGTESWIWPDGRFGSWDKKALARARGSHDSGSDSPRAAGEEDADNG